VPTKYLVLLALLVLPQMPRVQGGNAAIATFTGKFHSADKKFVTIEVEEGQSMQMYVTGSTRFIRDGKPVKASDFQAGENVTVETERDARLNLVAVRVEAIPAKSPERRPEN
jgi:hypothetical protein